MTYNSVMEREGEYVEDYRGMEVLFDVIWEFSCKTRVFVCPADMLGWHCPAHLSIYIRRL